MTDEAWVQQHLIYERMARAILACPIPIIAAVNGAAYGGGCEIALACDFIYAAEQARFALTEVTLGIMPGAGGTQNLPRAVGERRAKEVILTGKPFTAAEAQQWGLVNRVLPSAELVPAAIETADCHCAQCADLRAPGQAGHKPRLEYVTLGRPRLGDRSVSPNDPHRRSPRRDQIVQRKTAAEFQGQVKRVYLAKAMCRMSALMTAIEGTTASPPLNENAVADPTRPFVARLRCRCSAAQRPPKQRLRTTSGL